MAESRHILRAFESALDSLRADVLMMASLISSASAITPRKTGEDAVHTAEAEDIRHPNNLLEAA